MLHSVQRVNSASARFILGNDDMLNDAGFGIY